MIISPIVTEQKKKGYMSTWVAKCEKPKQTAEYRFIGN